MCQNDISQTFLKLIIFTAFRKDGAMGWKIQFNLLLLIALGFEMSEIYCRLYCIISIAIFFISFIIWSHVFLYWFWNLLDDLEFTLFKIYLNHSLHILVNQNRIFFSTKKLENQNFFVYFYCSKFFYHPDF